MNCFWMGHPWPHFRKLLFFSNNFTVKTEHFSGIWTGIVREEGKHADRMTTTTTAPRLKS